MAAAYRLYLEMGFVACRPYNGPALPGIVYMTKDLKSAQNPLAFPPCPC